MLWMQSYASTFLGNAVPYGFVGVSLFLEHTHAAALVLDDPSCWFIQVACHKCNELIQSWHQAQHFSLFGTVYRAEHVILGAEHGYCPTQWGLQVWRGVEHVA